MLTIDVEIVNAIDLSVPNGGLTFESCRFLSGDQDFPTLDGLTVTSIARPGSSFDTTCRITGTLIPATNANDIERTYIIRSRSAAPPFPFSYTPLTVNVVVPESSTSPKLPDEAVNAITADGVALPNAVIVRNLFAGADITECFFIDGSNAQQATLDGLSIAKATDGRACLITGTLRGTGTKTFNVRALSAAGQDDGSVVFSFSNDLTPVLSANLPSASPILGGQIEPIIISNTNPAITLKEGDCKLVDGAGNILLSRRAPSGRGRWRLDGLVMSDGPPESNTCVIEGAPSLHDRYDVRVRADNGVHMSNVIFWEFNVLLNPALDFAPDEVSRNVGGAPFTITPNAANTFDFSAATSTWSSSNNAVATVSANGEVTILTIGETVISVSTAAAPRIGTGMASYTLTVMAHPPNLPDSIATVVAVAGQTLAPTLSLANATDGADIVMCFLLDGATPMATLGGLSIAKAADNRSCIISGALTNAGDQTITVRATSASAQDEATVNFAVIPSTQAALRTPTTEFEVELNMQIDTVILNNFNTATATALAAGNCVLVDDMGDVISSALANNQYTVDGLTVATDVSAGTCTVTGTPTTAGRRTLNVRADNDNGVGNIIELTFIVRDIDTPGLEEDAVSKRFGDAAFTNAFTATTRSTDSFTWTSSTPSVATVGGDGEVTILTAGNTTIT
ncbi:MAG: Ig-like domain-containing protein, partial [Proteobacteria bacterium]|nr:Ig-like domain-containing protein [Pseudomonadota bacterium]